MKKLSLFVTIICLFYACKKETKQIESERTPFEITFQSNEGGVFFGSLQEGESFHFRVVSKLNPNKDLISAVGYGKANNQSIGESCNYTNASQGRFIKLPAGEYLYYLSIGNNPEIVKPYEFKITAGKCISINTRGSSW